jgi:hypothetical protein
MGGRKEKKRRRRRHHHRPLSIRDARGKLTRKTRKKKKRNGGERARLDAEWVVVLWVDAFVCVCVYIDLLLLL